MQYAIPSYRIVTVTIPLKQLVKLLRKFRSVDPACDLL
jgi:hypothetical protein